MKRDGIIRLFVLEDHSIIVDGLKKWFMHKRDKFHIEGWSNDPADFVKTVSGESFDIIILDLWFPDMDPIENLCLIQKKFPEKPVVALTNEQNVYWIKVMMEKGVKAYLRKDIERKELKNTLGKVQQGLTVIPSMLTDKSLSDKQMEFPVHEPCLLPSERSIVVQLSKGVILKEIARKRCTTISNIEKTVKNIRKKMKVKTNPELIRVFRSDKFNTRDHEKSILFDSVANRLWDQSCLSGESDSLIQCTCVSCGKFPGNAQHGRHYLNPIQGGTPDGGKSKRKHIQHGNHLGLQSGFTGYSWTFYRSRRGNDLRRN